MRPGNKDQPSFPNTFTLGALIPARSSSGPLTKNASRKVTVSAAAAGKRERVEYFHGQSFIKTASNAASVYSAVNKISPGTRYEAANRAERIPRSIDRQRKIPFSSPRDVRNKKNPFTRRLDPRRAFPKREHLFRCVTNNGVGKGRLSNEDGIIRGRRLAAKSTATLKLARAP